MVLSIKILADQNIPLLHHFFKDVADIRIVPAALIQTENFDGIDVLLVRSHTQVNKKLLENTSIMFVGSCVSGTDHLDTGYLDQSDIAWYAAKGCNAIAVMQYVEKIVEYLSQSRRFPLATLRQKDIHKKAAVVGVGYVGKQVVTMLQLKGFKVLQCDPLRAEIETDFDYTPMASLADIDLLCLHTPLTTESSYPTYHMIDAAFLRQLKSGCVIINAGRGDVIAPKVIGQFSDQFTWVLDVWPGEPHIDIALIHIAELVTPHIAGATKEGKWLGTKMVYDEMAKRFSWAEKKLPPLSMYQPHEHVIAVAKKFKQCVLQTPKRISEAFLTVRGQY